jgi:hypothetical protein
MRTATSSDTRLLVRKPIWQGRHLSWSRPSAPRSGSGFQDLGALLGGERIFGFVLTNPNLKWVLGFQGLFYKP